MYKLNLKFNTQIAFIEKPTLDGLLAYVCLKEEWGEVPQKLSLTEEELAQSEAIWNKRMPLKKHERGYWLASSLFYKPTRAIQDTQFWKKSWHTADDHLANFGKNKRQVNVQKGEFKSYKMPINSYHIPEAHFYFESDNPSELERMFRDEISHIGKKRSQGYGEIDSFKIVETTEKSFESDILRPIPLDFTGFKEGHEIQFTAWKPPYWLPSNFAPCLVPSFQFHQK